MAQERLRVTARGPKLVPHQGDGERPAGRQPVQPPRDLVPRLARIVDPGPDRDEVTSRAQLGDQAGRNSKSGSDTLDRWWHGTRCAQGRQQLFDPPAHLRVELRPEPRQSNPMPPSQERAGRNHLIQDPAQVAIGQRQWLLATMPGSAGGLRGAHLGHQDIDPNVGGQRRAAQVSAQDGEEATLGKPLLGGVDRPLAHAGWPQPALGLGRAPSTAIRIA